jgi:hypothetical protein
VRYASAALLLGLLLLAAALGAAACSLVEPKVGELLPTCGEGGAGPGSTYGARPMAGAGAASAAPPLTWCPPDAGSDCDDCESAACCATRLDCYGDALCACADRALDACLGALGAAAGDRSSPDVQRCWDAFAGVSPIAAARVACERAACAAACNVP